MSAAHCSAVHTLEGLGLLVVACPALVWLVVNSLQWPSDSAASSCADVVTLLCLRNAKEGGLSSWSSSISVYNEILRRRPDLARLLAGPWFFDRKGEVPEGKRGFFEIPVFNFYKASDHA